MKKSKEKIIDIAFTIDPSQLISLIHGHQLSLQWVDMPIKAVESEERKIFRVTVRIGYDRVSIPYAEYSELRSAKWELDRMKDIKKS